MILLEKRNGRLGAEEVLLAQYAKLHEIPVNFAVEKEVARNQIAVKDYSVVAGSIKFMKHALRAHGKELPPENSYPDCLKHLLYRDVKKIRSLREAKTFLDKGEAFFIKPVDLKRFTGFVTYDSDDWRFFGASDQTQAYLSTTVKFLSEWRCYVAGGTMLDVQYADHGGDRMITPDRSVMEEAIKLLAVSGAPSGYAIDFGVLDTGQTALVELNDGFSIGAYGSISCESYWPVIHSRWNELIA